MFQRSSASTFREIDGGLPCQASADSVMDYGQYVILSTGNFLCSAPTINSTMDFSVKHIDDEVVDSPPDRKPRVPASCSPSPLRSRDRWASSMSPTASDRGTQRKLYGDANYPTSTPDVIVEVPDKPRDANVFVPAIPPSLPRRRLSSQGQGLKQKHGGSSCSQCSTPSRDSWERRSLQSQRREDCRQTGTTTKVYS